jgi:hypothetical protein
MSVTGEVQCPRCLNKFCVTVVNKPEIVIHPNNQTTTGEVVCSLCGCLHGAFLTCPKPKTLTK